jgi:hypothetical protein
MQCNELLVSGLEDDFSVEVVVFDGVGLEVVVVLVEYGFLKLND